MNKSTSAKYDFNAAWEYLLSIKEGGGGCYGFDKFFKFAEDKNIAKYLMAEFQPLNNNVYALFCEDFFIEEIDPNAKDGKSLFKAVLDDIIHRRGEWKD